MLIAHRLGHYEVLGTSLDDSVGEAIDKAVKYMKIPWTEQTVGAALEKLALEGDPNRFLLPIPMQHSADRFNFSFSGLKSALQKKLQDLSSTQEIDTQTISDLCASFQHSAFSHITNRLSNALKYLQRREITITSLVVSGGVAQNRKLQEMLKDTVRPINMYVPSKNLCGDNAAMIGLAALLRKENGLPLNGEGEVLAKWPLDSVDMKA